MYPHFSINRQWDRSSIHAYLAQVPLGRYATQYIAHKSEFIYICNVNADLNINTILTQVKQLDRADQLSLLKKLALLIRKSDTVGNETKLSAISGIGSSLWSKTNIDEYIEQERQW